MFFQEIQSRFVASLIADITAKSVSVVESTIAAETEWTNAVHESVKDALILDVATSSWYVGSNIPGKKVESLCYLGGIPAYISKLKECEESGWEGWALQ